MMMAKDGEVVLVLQPLLGLTAHFSAVLQEPSGRSPDRGPCHDIENKLSCKDDTAKRLRRPSWTTRRKTADNRPWRAIWLGTKSRSSVATCTVQKVGSINGKHATKPTTRHGPPVGVRSRSASRAKHLSPLSSVFSP